MGRGTEPGPPQGKEQWGTRLPDPTSTTDAGSPEHRMGTQQWRRRLRLTQGSPTAAPWGISAAETGSRQRVHSPSPCPMPNHRHPPRGRPRGAPRGIRAGMRGSPWGRSRPPAGSRWRWGHGAQVNHYPPCPSSPRSPAAGCGQARITPFPPGRAAEGSSWWDEGSSTQNTGKEPRPLGWDGQQGLDGLLPWARTGMGVQEGCDNTPKPLIHVLISGTQGGRHWEFQGAFLPLRSGKTRYSTIK